MKHEGKLCRITERNLDPNKKPGEDRVSYDLQIALVDCNGNVVSWTTFQELIDVPAKHLVLLEQRCVWCDGTGWLPTKVLCRTCGGSGNVPTAVV